MAEIVTYKKLCLQSFSCKLSHAAANVCHSQTVGSMVKNDQDQNHFIGIDITAKKQIQQSSTSKCKEYAGVTAQLNVEKRSNKKPGARLFVI